MAKYKKCPRCELNYILSEEEMCDVCKAELGLETKLVLLDDIIDDDEPLRRCPVCKTNFIGLDEEMCESCLKHAAQEEVSDEDNDDWRTYLDDDPNEGVDDGDIPLEELEEEFDDEDEFEDEENVESEPDDFDDDEFVDASDLDDIDDEDDDDDDSDDDF